MLVKCRHLGIVRLYLLRAVKSVHVVSRDVSQHGQPTCTSADAFVQATADSRSLIVTLVKLIGRSPTPLKVTIRNVEQYACDCDLSCDLNATVSLQGHRKSANLSLIPA